MEDIELEEGNGDLTELSTVCFSPKPQKVVFCFKSVFLHDW